MDLLFGSRLPLVLVNYQQTDKKTDKQIDDFSDWIFSEYSYSNYRVYHYTVWTLLHNQTNQTNCWEKWNFLGFLRKIQISIDDSLCLIIICSHFVSIKSRKIRVFSKFSKNPVILPYKYLYLILLITKKPGHI